VNLIFVYGTLKRGGTNNYLLAGQEFAGAAQTVPGYAMYELEGYPGMVATAGEQGTVIGEVWGVDDQCLAGLDLLEGTSEGLYGRVRVELQGPFAGRRVEAYLYLKGVEGRPRLGDSWDG
jgi:gamma-glutamylaminecyclotransferase